MIKRSRKISLILLLVLLVQTVLPYANMNYMSYGASAPVVSPAVSTGAATVVAAPAPVAAPAAPAAAPAAGGDAGIAVVQSVTTSDSGNVIPGDQPVNEVTVELQYSTSAGVGAFHDVVLSYQLPLGAREGSVSWSRNVNVVEEPIYDSGSRTVSWKLGNSGMDTEVLDAGKSGELELTFDFDLPSAYPEDTSVMLLPGIATWNSVLGDAGTQNQFIGNRVFVQIKLPAAWNIYKQGPSEVAISSNPAVTELVVDYDVILRDGNIDLRDVVITDTKPALATFVSATITPQSVSDTSSVVEGGAVDTITLGEVPAGVDTTISLRYSFPIARTIGDVGLVGGNTETNVVEVVGYPIMTAEDGSVTKHSDQVVFLKNRDEVTTTFKESTVKWGIDIDGPIEYTLSSDVNVTDTDPLRYDISFIDGEIDLADVPVIFNIPSDATVSDYELGHNAVLDLGADTITWTIDNLEVGNAPDLFVKLTYPISRAGSTGVRHGDTKDNTVEVKLLAFSPSTDTVTTEFRVTDSYWYAQKTGPSSIAIPNLTDAYTSTVKYTLALIATIDGTTNKNENPPLEQVIIKDTLPAFAEIVDATPGYVQSGSDLTWTFDYNNTDADPLNDFDISNPPSVFVDVKYKVDRTDPYTGTDGIIPGASMTNQLEITADYHGDYSGTAKAYPFGGYGTTTKTTNAVQDSIPNPVIAIDIENFNNDRHYTKNDTITYLITAYNTGIPTKDVRIELEALPEEIGYETLTTGEANVSIPYTLEYQTKNKGSGAVSGWTHHSAGTTDVNVSIDVSTLLAADEILTAVKFIYGSDVDQNFNYTTKPSLSGKIVSDSDVLNPSYVENILKMYYKYQQYEKISAEKIKQDEVKFQILIDAAWVRTLSKQKLTAGASFYTSQPLDFRITLENDPLWATAGIENPIIIDYAPKALQYIADDKWSDTWMSNASTKTVPMPEFKVIEDYLNTGESVLIWGWGIDLDGDGNPAPDWTMNEGKRITIDYSMLIKSYAGNGNYSNKLFLQSANRLESATYSIEADSLDMDKDLDLLEENMIGTSANFTILETSALTSNKLVKGELDADYSSHPQKGATTPGGSSDYKLEIWNNGNVSINDLEFIDIFPFEGDMGVVDGKSRNSEWAPYMVQAFSGGYEATVKSMEGVTYTVPIKIEYSTAKDPIRDKVNPADGTIGTEEANWSITVPDDITSVKALKFSVDDFSANPLPDKNLAAGETLSVEWKMRTPVGSPTSDNIAWSSVAVRGIPKGKSKPLLWAEPNKVGIVVKSNPKGEIGNFVWFDQNNNGIQDDGYDDQSAGINGIKATLFKLNTGTGIFDEEAETLTSFDYDGNPGYYGFPNLEIGDYYVTYELPDNYELGQANLGGDDALDSDAFDDAGTIKSQTVSIDTAGNGIDKINNTLDVGLVAKNTLLPPSLGLTKEATHYKNTGGFVAFGANKIINKKETVQYKIQVINDGVNGSGEGVTLHNILLEDIITEVNSASGTVTNFSGFEFTSVSSIDKNGTVIKTYDNMDSSPSIVDPNIIYKSAQSNKVIINELAINEGYEFIGEYESTDAIVDDAPLINTVKIWANELKDKTDPTAPYDEKSAEVDVAYMTISKTITHVKRNASSTFEAISNGTDFGMEAGDTLRYEITVVNSGNTALTAVRVNDPIAGINNQLVGTIPVGGTEKVTGEYVVVRGATDTIINTASATATDIRYPVVTTHTAYFKGLSIQKKITLVNGVVPVLVGGEVIVKVGDVIEYTMTFTNTDSKALTDIMITKDHLVSIKNAGVPENLLSNYLVAVNLDPSQSITHVVEYTVKSTDVTMSSSIPIVNTVYGKSAGTGEKNAEISAEIASLALDKKANQSTYRTEGTLITYTIAVTNNGTVDLVDVIVKDDLLALNETVNLLKVDETEIFTKTYKITEQDVTKRSVRNIASAETVLSGKVTDEVIITYYKKSSGGGGTTNKPSIPPKPPTEPEVPVNPEPEVPVNPEPEIPVNPEPEVTPEPPVYIPDEGIIIIEIVEPPALGTVKIDDDGSVHYTPKQTDKVGDSFTIKVNDGGEERIITITIPGEDLAQGGLILPQTGEGIPFRHYVIGTIFLLLGILQFRRKRRLYNTQTIKIN